MRSYDVVVLGAGGVGSAALYHLARRGARVLGIDRFTPPHDRGSSHGRTRMIRQAYFEHPDYVPLVLRAYELWAELERTSGRTLFHRTGVLECGPPEGTVVQGVLRSAQQHNLDVEQLTPREAMDRWAGFRIPDDFAVLFEPLGGYLPVEDCVEAQLEFAQRAGAELLFQCTVVDWRVVGQRLEVTSDAGSFAADQLVITAGAWAGSWLADLGWSLVVRRKPQYWFRATAAGALAEESGCPAFYFDTPGGGFYGFPRIGDTIKVAEHTGGREVADPLTLDRAVDEADLARVREFVGQYLVDLDAAELANHAACMYTMSADEHFIVDRHPRQRNVTLVAGLSGHGFKFTPVLGEIIADLALRGRTGHRIEFLSSSRPGLRHGSEK